MMIEKNRRKGMELFGLWLNPDETKLIMYVMTKKRIDDFDLRQVGDILITAKKRGDMEKR